MERPRQAWPYTWRSTKQISRSEGWPHRPRNNMAHSFDQFQAQRDAALQDAAAKLATADRDRMLVQAILQRYSKDRPRVIVTDVTALGTSDLPLPTVDEDADGAFEDGFSEVTQLEYPPAGVPENI